MATWTGRGISSGWEGFGLGAAPGPPKGVVRLALGFGTRTEGKFSSAKEVGTWSTMRTGERQTVGPLEQGDPPGESCMTGRGG